MPLRSSVAMTAGGSAWSGLPYLGALAGMASTCTICQAHVHLQGGVIRVIGVAAVPEKALVFEAGGMGAPVCLQGATTVSAGKRGSAVMSMSDAQECAQFTLARRTTATKLSQKLQLSGAERAMRACCLYQLMVLR